MPKSDIDPTFDGKTRKKAGIFGQCIRLLFAIRTIRHLRTQIAQKCKLLLHLGNSVAFFVDNPTAADIRFSLPALRVDKFECGFSSPRVNLWSFSYGLCP